MTFKYLFLFFSFSIFAQQNIQLSDKAEISILTCAPGQNELYSYFGHSAMRVKDPKNNIDKFYNYGTFDFNTPNFYLKFCQGKLLYEVATHHFKYFPYLYYKEKRWVKSQVLNFTTLQNQKLFDYLEWNSLPENKKYYYDFFYDNCATKMYEVIEKSIGKIDFDYSKFPKNMTHRNLIHSRLANNSWGKFGIDLALGAVIDKKATLKQYMFLPEYVYSGIENSSLNGNKTIAKTSNILPDYHLKLPETNFFISPLFVSILLLVITLTLTFSNNFNRWFNCISFIFGVLGIVLFCLWFLTEHSTTKMNMNLLWCNPFLIFYPFLKLKNKQLTSYLQLISLTLFTIIALTKFQEFNVCFYLLAICTIPLCLKTILKIKK